MQIIGTGSALPEKTIYNEDLSQFLDTSDEWITSRTGIKERRILTNEKIEDLAAQAANKSLEAANISPLDLDYIICSNVYSPYITPSLASVIQGIIGAKCPAIDINVACVGFIYGLQLAQGLLKTGCQKILVISAESMSRMVDWTDRATCVLFGDGSAAAIVSNEGEDACFQMGTSSNKDVLYATSQPSNCPYTTVQMEDSLLVQMQGQEVFKFAVSSSVKDIRFLMDKHKLNPEDIKFYLLHQANLRIVEAVKKRLGANDEKCPTNVQRFGNTSSVSVPLLLDEINRSGKLQRGDKLVLSAFGAGLTTGACLLKW